MKIIKLYFPSILVSLWGGISIAVFLFLLNYPSFDISYIFIVGVYFLIFLFPLIIISTFVRAIFGGEISALNSRYLCGLFFIVSIFLALAVYLNLPYFRNLLPQKAYFTVAGLGIVFAVIALLSLSLIQRKSRVVFVIFYVLAVLSVLSFTYMVNSFQKNEEVKNLPFQLQPPERRVVVIYMEGLSLEDVLKISEKVELPNFSYLLERGAWGKVSSPEPCSSEVTFYSFLRGKTPGETGYTSSFMYSIAGRGELRILPRWMLFQGLKKLKIIRVKGRIKRPNDGIVKLVRKTGARASTVEAEVVPLREDLVISIFPKAKRKSWQFKVLLDALSRDNFVAEQAIKLMGKRKLIVVKFQGMRDIKVHFLRYTSGYYPFVSPENLEKYMDTVEKYYQFYDHIIGRFLTLSSAEDLLLIVSPFSVDPLPPWRSYLEVLLGDKFVCGDYFDCPQGVYFAFSKYISPKNTSINLLDFVPTISYFLGLPVEKDSRGRVVSEIFNKEFSFENPVFFIHTYSRILEEGRR